MVIKAVRLDGNVGVYMDRDYFNKFDQRFRYMAERLNDSRMSQSGYDQITELFDEIDLVGFTVDDPGSFSVENYNGE